eukprot:CAMPEP_0201654744 /NCGR_PEP_ID=MMETSP0493-20130528/45654_1 /ASSEMBLY_ACC=CAM_ASM_000838 /TAXON_ID=420259 /ORGANISM="Thalassiosira gravida, Strain GMp14c1" /LENGTH=536 /DNA_ID=CAMNT_0048131311 /DNA_START=55 /DNA_END=1668 /DNA_ORIENTATION=+
MILRNVICIAFISSTIIPNNGVHSYLPSPLTTPRSGRRSWRPSMVQLRRVVRSWQPLPTTTTAMRIGSTSSQLSSGSFYDDFEDFGELGSNDSNNDDDDDGGSDNKGISGEISKPDFPSGGGDGGVDSNAMGATDDAVMRSLRERMNDLSNQIDDGEDDEEEEEEEEEFDDADSGSALPDLEGSTISNIDDLIGFAQAKARAKAKDSKGGDTTVGGGTWEDENWAKAVPRVDDTTEEALDFDDILEGGVVLIANPAKFCSDLVDEDDIEEKPKGKGSSFLGGLFDDPFPQSDKNPNFAGSISLALLAKFGITLPPSPDLGPDRRADLLPVVLLMDRDPVKGCQAVLMNRRTGNLMGDLPPSIFETTDVGDNAGDGGFSPHPLSAFMIQPLWWAGSSPGGNSMDEENPSNRGGGLKAIDMVHACPYVNGSVPLAKSDGLYWGGSPVQAQEAMKDGRLEKPLSGFDFKFFIQTTRWLPSQLEQEIKDGTWYVATVSREVLFRSRDRLGAKRAKPLWTEIIELLGDEYKHIRDQLYGEE